MLMNDPQTAGELPTKIISFVGEVAHRRSHKWSNSSELFWLCWWMIHRLPSNYRRKLFHFRARLDTDGTINEVTPLNRAELCESVVFLHSQSSMTVIMNDPQTASELPTKIISFAGEDGHRRSHKWSYSSESRRIVRKCSFLTQSK